MAFGGPKPPASIGTKKKDLDEEGVSIAGDMTAFSL